MTNQSNHFLQDLKGIIIKPGPTLGKIAERKQWVTAFIIICLSLFIMAYITSPETIKQLNESMADGQSGLFIKDTPMTRALLSLVSLFLFFIQLVIGAFFIYLFFGIGKVKGIYVNFFSLTVNASIVGSLLPAMIKFIAYLLNIQQAIVTNFTFIIPSQPPRAWLYAILSQFDLFYIWFLIILSLGVCSYGKINKLKSFIIAFLYFIFRSSILVLFIILMGKLRHGMPV